MDYQLGVIGGWAMGEAIVAGATRTGQFTPSKILISDPLAARRNYLSDKYQVKAAEDNHQVFLNSEVIVMAIKPQNFMGVLQPLAVGLVPSQLLISIAAGVSIASIEAVVPAEIPVIRIMPNTPCLIGQGVSVIASGTKVEAKHRILAEKLFSSLGKTFNLSEEYLNAVTALSGSGPAYVYLIAEALIDAGVRIGLPRDLSKELTLQTIAGATQMVWETGKHPAELKDMVTSPGGTTAAALEVLEEKGIRGNLIKAVLSAFKRAEQLSRSN